jgi:Sulfotransferase domain
MDNKKNIVWLASYPKSGNTWFRSFLTALLSQKEVDLDKMETNGIFSGKTPIEDVLDLSADYLRLEQIEAYQRLAFSYLSDTAEKPLFIKIHDAFTVSERDKLPLIPEKPTKVALYFIRNPLDVTLSLANHIGKDIETTIEKFIINPKGSFLRKKNTANIQFYQPLGTWSNHVESWQNCPTFPVHFMRYEDMKSQPFETFKAAVMAIGLDYSDNDIQQAIEAVEFEKLQKKERDKGFKEKQNPTSSFFFKGQVGRWKTELTAEQIEKIKTVNEPMMREFGYWD